MNVRTVTYFLDPGLPLADERFVAAGRTVSEARAALVEAGYTVQTTRLAITPFARVLGGDAGRVQQLALDLEAACFVHKLYYATLGPARPGDGPAFYRAIPEALGATEHVFASASIAEPGGGLSLPAVRWAADVIHACATLTPDGFGNLRFAALANVASGAPFFPAAYHDASAPAFAIGVEAADLAVTACAEAATLAEARARLVRLVEDHAGRITRAVKKVRGARFGGIDFTLAPFPEAARSLGTAVERLTGHPLGLHGTLAAAAFLADSLDRAKLPHVGFSGLFFPVLEDAALAARAAEGRLNVNDLLLYCAVCGAGLDTVPLPGDTSASALAAILLDVGALALRLNKPLTARLMPVPGKQAGDEVKWDFPYFAPSRVLAARAEGVGGLFAADETVELAPRSR